MIALQHVDIVHNQIVHWRFDQQREYLGAYLLVRIYEVESMLLRANYRQIKSSFQLLPER